VILNGGLVARKGRELRVWKTLSEFLNSIKHFENRIYGAFGSAEKVLVEMIRVAHRQFIWQANPPNSASIIRYYKIFNRPLIDEVSQQKIGLGVWEIFMCATACMGLFLDRPAIAIPFKVEIRALSVQAIERFLSFTSRPLSELRAKLKSEQKYDADFAYAYNSLRAYPLVRMTYQGREALVCPIMTLLYWRFTSGLYYELIGVPEFANEFGEGFNAYVGEVIERACLPPMCHLAEQPYTVGKAQKRSVDWIVSDSDAALFVECKVRRLSPEGEVLAYRHLSAGEGHRQPSRRGGAGLQDQCRSRRGRVPAFCFRAGPSDLPCSGHPRELADVWSGDDDEAGRGCRDQV
jgi:hypothetical protein